MWEYNRFSSRYNIAISADTYSGATVWLFEPRPDFPFPEEVHPLRIALTYNETREIVSQLKSVLEHRDTQEEWIRFPIPQGHNIQSQEHNAVELYWYEWRNIVRHLEELFAGRES